MVIVSRIFGLIAEQKTYESPVECSDVRATQQNKSSLVTILLTQSELNCAGIEPSGAGTPNNNPGSLSDGAIAGIVVAGAVVVAGVIVTAVLVTKKQQRDTQAHNLTHRISQGTRVRENGAINFRRICSIPATTDRRYHHGDDLVRRTINACSFP
jgi:hypothetical protein